MELYARVRWACMVEGMSIRARRRSVYGLHRDTVRKMLKHSVPPGYRRKRPPRRSKLDPYRGVIDRDLEQDRGLPKKQRHTAKRIYERLRTEYGFGGKYTIVKDYLREHRRRTREMYVPLTHPAGHVTCPQAASVDRRKSSITHHSCRTMLSRLLEPCSSID